MATRRRGILGIVLGIVFSVFMFGCTDPSDVAKGDASSLQPLGGVGDETDPFRYHVLRNGEDEALVALPEMISGQTSFLVITVDSDPSWPLGIQARVTCSCLSATIRNSPDRAMHLEIRITPTEIGRIAREVHLVDDAENPVVRLRLLGQSRFPAWSFDRKYIILSSEFSEKRPLTLRLDSSASVRSVHSQNGLVEIEEMETKESERLYEVSIKNPKDILGNHTSDGVVFEISDGQQRIHTAIPVLFRAVSFVDPVPAVLLMGSIPVGATSSGYTRLRGLGDVDIWVESTAVFTCELSSTGSGVTDLCVKLSPQSAGEIREDVSVWLTDRASGNKQLLRIPVRAHAQL